MRLPTRTETRAGLAGFILGAAFMASPALGVTLGALALVGLWIILD